MRQLLESVADGQLSLKQIDASSMVIMSGYTSYTHGIYPFSKCRLHTGFFLISRVKNTNVRTRGNDFLSPTAGNFDLIEC